MSNTLIASEDFSTYSKLSSSQAGGLGTIAAGALLRGLIGPRISSGSRGYFGYTSSASSAVMQSYQNPALANSNAQPNGFLYGWFNFSLFDQNNDGSTGTIYSRLFDMLIATTDNPSTGTQKGTMLIVRGDGTLGLYTNNGPTLSSTKLTKGAWSRIAVEWFQQASTNEVVSFLFVGDNNPADPMTCVAAQSNSGNSAVNYVGLSNGTCAGGVGGNYRVGEYLAYKKSRPCDWQYVKNNTGSPTLTAVTNPSSVVAGSLVTCPGVPIGTTVVSVNVGASTVLMSANSTLGDGNTFTAAGFSAAGDDITTLTSGILAPPTGPFTFNINDLTAAGGGDGSSRSPITYFEACQYVSLGVSPSVTGVTHNWVQASGGAAVDPTAYTSDALTDLYVAGTIIPNPQLDVWSFGANVSATENSSGIMQGMCVASGSAAQCVIKTNGFNLNFYKTLDPTTATQYDAVHYPNVWKIAAPAGSQIQEDGKALGMVNGGTTITSATVTESGVGYADARTAINSVAGTQFNQGGYIYFSTFDGAAPTTHTYQRSGGNDGSFFAVASVTGLVNATGSQIAGTACNLSTSGLIGMWHFAFSDSDYSVFDGGTHYWWTDHISGTSGSSGNGRLSVLNQVVGPGYCSQGSGAARYWGTGGGGVAFESFSGATSQVTPGAQHTYRNITVYGDSTVGQPSVGSAAVGRVNSNTNSMQAHAGQGATGSQFDSISVSNATAWGAVSYPLPVKTAILSNVRAPVITLLNSTTVSLDNVQNFIPVNIKNGTPLAGLTGTLAGGTPFVLRKRGRLTGNCN